MIIKTFYLGRIEAFDTDHFTETLPCRGNLLINYALDASPALEGGSCSLRITTHTAGTTDGSFKILTVLSGLFAELNTILKMRHFFCQRTGFVAGDSND